MKTIIIASDFSAEAENATMYAATAAAQRGYKVVLFTLQNISVHALNARISAASFDQLLAVYQAKIADIASSLSDLYGIEVLPHMATGNFYEELERCIHQHQADLVVMGMAERSLEQDLLGNTTTVAINRLKFPVLAIPSGARFTGIQKILFASDMLRGVHKSILQKVKEFAADFGAAVEVFHVRDKVAEIVHSSIAQTNLDSVKEALSGITYYYKNVQSKLVIAAIKEEMESTAADLLIMVPYKHGFWNAMIHRSKTRIMASGISIPLLSLPL